MLDIKWIRENAETYDSTQAKRGLEPQAAQLIALDDARRAHIQKLQAAQERRNSASKEIGKAKASGDEDKARIVIAEVAELKAFVQSGEEKERALTEALDTELSSIPNLLLDEVPVGKDEEDNILHSVEGDKPKFDFEPREHYELGEALGLMDFEVASRLAGARFVILRKGLARLERALGQFMLDMHTRDHGLEEVQPPLLVRDEVMFGTNQLPKFAEDSFKTTDGKWLIPTSEVTLTNQVRESVLDAADLPLRYTALTPCFRSEAGSAGRDTRGMLRQHQFNKVEMVSITKPENSLSEQARMLDCAENVLKALGLHYQVVLLCSGDTGFGARRTYDIEAWLPGQNAYREISSISVCGDFQARRMQARYRIPGEKTLHYVHTLNGSGVAVGRCLIAIMENYQNEDGSISIPDVLQPYMHGQSVLAAT